MQIKLYGTRGSIPVCESEYREYGGNTTCIFIKVKDCIFILDAGTGIRNLGKELAKCDEAECNRVFIGFSHFHWDHIQGFPFFLPAYDNNREFTITTISREAKFKNVKNIFETQMRKEYFPIPLEKMGAKLNFLHEDSDNFAVEKIKIRTAEHNHPGGALSYRIEAGGKAFVFCTDIEHGNTFDERVLEIADGADLLIHEGMYTQEQMVNREGWGHSSWQQAIEVAKLAKVKKLIITHHDPDHDDKFLRKQEKLSKDLFEDVEFARDKMEINI